MKIIPRKPYRILTGDAREMLRTLPNESVHCVVTSPPYWGLRDYGCDGQLGLEPTIELYVEHMVEVFREVRRVLRKNGTLWLNIGDCYAAGKAGRTDHGTNDPTVNLVGNSSGAVSPGPVITRKPPKGLKPKDLVGQPWRVAFALQGFAVVPGAALNDAADLLAEAREAGDWEGVRGVEGMLRAWARASAFLDPSWLRSDIVWAKPNPMPESCRDRPTKSHEYVFMLTKAAKYFFDQEAVREPVKAISGEYSVAPHRDHVLQTGHRKQHLKVYDRICGANIRSVWTIPTQAFSEAHFATFPEALPERCIKAGTSEKGCCPECGAPYVRVVEKSRTFESGSGRSGRDPVGKHGAGLQGGGETKDVRRGPCIYSRTTGWSPTCKHDAEPVPCTVLDPFIGSGTTALVAVKLGRRAIGIDLSAKYTNMVEKQLAVAVLGGSRRPRKFRLKGRKKIRRLSAEGT